MRKITLITLMFFTALSYAQVGINTNTPDASSALEIASTTGGILIPRLTETQRDAIVTPATGLMIYQTDQTTGFYFFNGIAWTRIEGVVGPQGETGPAGPQGPQGTPGVAGADGTNGSDGADGTDGSSAYEIWVAAGNTGTESDFLASLVGAQGEQGLQGPQGETGATGAAGPTGPQGPQGPQGVHGVAGADGTNGTNGSDGVDGSSAYEIWVAAGNTGTESDFLASLVGADGETALIKTTNEPAGDNCASGGTKIEVGLDNNSNGVLDQDEINSTLTQYLCEHNSNYNGNVSDYHGTISLFENETLNWTVPDGVSMLNISMTGASGGRSGYVCSSPSNCLTTCYFGSGGSAISSTFMLGVTPGQELNFIVGSNGANGNNSSSYSSSGTPGESGTNTYISSGGNVIVQLTGGGGGIGNHQNCNQVINGESGNASFQSGFGVFLFQSQIGGYNGMTGTCKILIEW